MTRPISEVATTAQYFDGLGRLTQTVIKGGSLETATGNSADMVKQEEYDQFGRQPKQYLPFAANASAGNTSINDGGYKSIGVTSQLNSFYTALLNGQNETGNYNYSLAVFEASPLNRPLEQYAPGANWAGTESSTKRSVKQGNYLNTTTDDVRIWKVTDNFTLGNWGSYTSTGTYPVNTLYKSITTDEHGKQVIEFKDKTGNLILKKVQLIAAADNGNGDGYVGWICTYYIYDDLNNLRCVVQPEGVNWLSIPANNWNLGNTTILTEQCFRYEYDQRNRMIMKQVPGAAPVYMVYDSRDRLVLTQDGNMRSGSTRWQYTWYDALNRPTNTGIWTTTTNFAKHITDAAAIPYGDNTTYPPLSAPGLEELTQTFYDDYSWSSGTPVSANFSSVDQTQFSYFTSDNNNNFPYQRKVQPTLLPLKGMVTGSKVKVLGSGSPGTWLWQKNFYDDYGRAVQVQSVNMTGGLDIVTTQYSFSGQPLTSASRQVINSSPVQILVIVTEMTYDDLGRLSETKQKQSHTQVNSGAMSTAKTIAKQQYDALGQLKTKQLGTDPATGAPLETMSYDYNIRGWLLGANRQFVKVNAAKTNWFGFDLGYNKTSNSYGSITVGGLPQYNGNISTSAWRSRGNCDMFQYYDCRYDAANRLEAAYYKVVTSTSSGSPNAAYADQYSFFSGDALGSNTMYDLNGNIKKMIHCGMPLAGTAYTYIDNLQYSYQSLSNRLAKVTDLNTTAMGLGDFTDKNTSGDDYGYDTNGNLVTDLNKRLNGTTGSNLTSGGAITYNHLNLPAQVTVKNDAGTTTKGTITYTYDAAGSKIQKQTIESGVTIGSTSNITVTTTTHYLGAAVYESKTYSTVPSGYASYNYKLQFAGHAEGRMRALRAYPQDNPSGLVYDYFLKDHLGNVRMVLTEETKINRYPATTLEGSTTAGTNSLVNTERNFYRIDDTKIILESSITGTPPWIPETGTNKDYYNNNGNPPANDAYPAGVSPLPTDRSTKLYKLNATANKTGLDFMIKVMAGDVVDIFGKSYYQNTTNITNSNSTALDWLSIFASMLASPVNPLAAKGLTGTQINSLNGAGILPSSFIRGANNEATTTVPKAYINYIFFDEQFKYAGGGASRVGTSGAVKDHWTIDQAQLSNIPVPKNGYLYVYVSNESNFDVFFDNIQVIHKPGPLLEETHYYPFGLTMVGISSKAAGSLENKTKYNGIEQNNDFDLNIYDAFYRNLDPQLGRFWQVDPETESLEEYSPYASMYNNPISNTDPLGDFAGPVGAWLYKVFHGGGTIGQNQHGEYYVQKATNANDGTVSLTYGKGRRFNETEREELASEYAVMMDIDMNGDNSLYQMYDTPQDAGWGAARTGTGLATPSVSVRPITTTANAAKVANQGRKIIQSIKKTISLQKQARHILGTAKAGGGYLNSVADAQKVLDAVHSGEAVFIGTTKAGQPVFRYSGVTGTHVNNGVGVTGQPTNLFMIKGTTAPSVVPLNPAKIL